MRVALCLRPCAENVKKKWRCIKDVHYLSEGSRFSGRIFKRAPGPKILMTTPRVLSASSLYSKFFCVRRMPIFSTIPGRRTSAAVGSVTVLRYRRTCTREEITDSNSGIDLANVSESNAFCVCVMIFMTTEASAPWCESDRAFSMREGVKHVEMRSSASAADFRVSRSGDSRKFQTLLQARGSSDAKLSGAVSLYDTRAFATTSVHAGATVVSLG